MYSEGQTIHYYIEEKSLKESIKEITVQPDKLDDRVIRAVENLFPFTRSSAKKTLTCPNWAKSLLYKFNTLEEVEKMIKYFNMGGESRKERDHPHDQKISYLLIQDVFLQGFTRYEYESVDGDATIDFVIHPLEKDKETITFQKKVPNEMKLNDFKSMILFKTNNQPFNLKFFMRNELTVSDLKK